jgi:hypothetical protein
VTIAYLDPGSGSLIASALVGGVAAAGVVAKQARAKLGGFGRKRKASDEDAQAAEVTAPESAPESPAGEAVLSDESTAVPTEH